MRNVVLWRTVVSRLVVVAPFVALVILMNRIPRILVARVVCSLLVGVKFLGREEKHLPVRLTATVLTSALTPAE